MIYCSQASRDSELNKNLFFCSCLSGGDSWQPNLVFDDGGDMTHVLLKKFPALASMCKGIVEETITGAYEKGREKEERLECQKVKSNVLSDAKEGYNVYEKGC